MTRWYVLFDMCHHWRKVEDPSPAQTIWPGTLYPCRTCALLGCVDEVIRPVAHVLPATIVVGV